MSVDTHTHVAERAGVDTASLRAGMYAAGVDRALLVQGFAAHAYDNTYVLDAAARDARRFAAVPVVDPRESAVASARSLLAHEPAGLRVYAVGEKHGWSEALWDFLAAERVPTAVAVLPADLAALAAVAAARPDLPLALDGCGFTDAADGRLQAVAALPNVWAKLTTYNLDRDAGAVADVVKLFGAGRVMWGSDFGQPAGPPYPEAVAVARAACAALGEADRESVLGGNATRFWRLP